MAASSPLFFPFLMLCFQNLHRPSYALCQLYVVPGHSLVYYGTHGSCSSLPRPAKVSSLSSLPCFAVPRCSVRGMRPTSLSADPQGQQRCVEGRFCAQCWPPLLLLLLPSHPVKAEGACTPSLARVYSIPYRT